MKKAATAYTLIVSIVVASINLTQVANAVKKTTMTFNVQSTPNAGESLVTFYGQVKPAAKAKILISSFDGQKWKPTNLTATSSSSGAWRIATVATAIKAEGKYRATATVKGKKITASAKVFRLDTTKTFSDLTLFLFHQRLVS